FPDDRHDLVPVNVGNARKHLASARGNLELLSGLFLEPMAKQFGNFIGVFVDYDGKSASRGFWNYMSVRVKIDVGAFE
ncbi:hypothetical protein Gohar_015622, partial [Gossypium harknessii]|nr:hypothetical protein [Gossypium harknessii]